MSALERMAAMILALLLVMTGVHRLSRPVHRADIRPRPTGLRINVNTADIATLSLLSGVSTTIGEYIVQHRTQHGPIRSLADLDQIRFIGPTTLRKIGPYVTFDTVQE